MQWLKERNASDNVCELFMSFRLSGQIDAGDGLIFTDNQIMKRNEFFDESRESHYVIIGCCGTYDLILMDVVSGIVGYVPHRCDTNNIETIKKNFRKAANDLPCFLKGVNIDNNIPDNYDALFKGDTKATKNREYFMLENR